MTTTARELAEEIIERANNSRDPLFWKPALITELTLTIERAELRGEQRGRESVLSRVPSEDQVMEAEGIDWDDPLGVYYYIRSQLTLAPNEPEVKAQGFEEIVWHLIDQVDESAPNWDEHHTEIVNELNKAFQAGQASQVVNEVVNKNQVVNAVVKELDHPCKNTCSGWKQGFEAGQTVLSGVNAQLLTSTNSSQISSIEWTPQRAINACLEYCEPHLNQMWAARIVGYLLNCDFQDAKIQLAKLKEPT